MALLALLVVDNDPAAIAASIVQLSWRLAVVIVFPAVLVQVADTLGWRYAFADDATRVPRLLAVRVAGEAFNMATPTATLGGEAVKSWLLRERVPLAESVPSLIIAKTTITVAQGVLLLLGVVLARTTLAADTPLLIAMQMLVVIEAVALGAFAVAQTRGLLGRGGRLLSRLGLQALVGGETLGRVDQALIDFYRDHRGRLVLSTAWHLAGWLLGALETWLILRFLGADVSLLTATVIEAFAMGIRVATFLIPGNIGVLEGGYAAIFGALGLGSTAGVTFSLVRRLRELAWIAIGLLVFAAMRPAGAARGDARTA